MRHRIALAVIVLHGMLLWLLAAGFRQRDSRPEAPQLQIVSLWITPPAPQRPVEPLLPAEQTTSSTSSTTPALAAPPAVAPNASPIEPQPESNAPPATTTPQVDWANEGSRVARQAGESIGAGPGPEPFSEGPKGVRKQCVPKERSMEWKGEENPGVHWVGPFPVLVTKRCAITVGFFSCALGKLPEPNSHLLDDMQDPTRSRSSVPDPNICD
jgi:hypothetical protein